MNFCRAIAMVVTAVLLAADPASAQGLNQEPPCMKDFMPLRKDVENKAAAIRAANKRRVPPAEACRLFKVFSAAEVKLIKFSEENRVWCGIPEQAVKSMKDNHAKTVQISARVCQAAARPPPPAGPSLSEALGTTDVPNPDNAKRGHGTFDTLIGTPLGNR